MQTTIKKQKAEQLFRDTFRDAILQFREPNVYFIGRKMYIKVGRVIVSVEFAGNNTAFNNIILTAMSIDGIIDQNITPMSMLFTKSKAGNGHDKIVNLRMILSTTGEHTYIWTGELEDEDIMNLNNFLINYVELFSSL